MTLSLECCELCPRKCRVNRNAARGRCGCGSDVYVARVMLHMWEEPCISGKNGSGAVFFCGCPLGCVFCQNAEISHPVIMQRNGGDFSAPHNDFTPYNGAAPRNCGEMTAPEKGADFGKRAPFGKGRIYTKEQLVRTFIDLQNRGAHNINLVSPTQYTPQLIDAVKGAREGGLEIPVVWNTGGYERPETIRALHGIVDIFLCDIKYFSPDISRELSDCSDYARFALESLREMLRITGGVQMTSDSVMKKGVIVRHLVLPGCRRDSAEVLKAVAEAVPADKVILSLMRQYTPDFFRGCNDKHLDRSLRRRVTSFEYNFAVDAATELGFNGYMQGRESAARVYTPIWED